VAAALEIAWWLFAAWLLVSILRSVLVFENRPREGKLLQDILAGLIYLTAIFAIVAYVFDLPIQGLLATSGAIAIIIGLALQSSLGDVFSGLVLNFSRPYRTDDWIRLDDGTEGQVIELNWRATLILTSQRDLAIVPNSAIAKSKIVNVSSPSRIHGMSVTVPLDARAAPSASIAVLRHALLNSRSILASPEPSILVKSMNVDAVEFELTFFVTDLNAAAATQNELFDLIHRHLASAGIALAAPGQPAPEAATSKPGSDVERLLDQTSIFASLTVEERAALAAKLKRKRYDQDEILVQPDVVLQSLFLIGTGVLSIARQEGGVDFEVLRLGPGDRFGEVGLLTGHSSSARITALTPAVVYELPKADLAPILKTRPQIAQDLCHELAQRQAAGRTIAATEPSEVKSVKNLGDWLHGEMHKLFELGGV
jgi:small-conductance mechanosensitive channel